MLIFPLLTVSKKISTIQILIRNTRLILTLAITSGVPMAVVNKQRETPLLAADETSKVLSA